MIEPLSPETLAWLQQAASAGVAEPMVLMHVFERLDALEASDRIDAEAWASVRRASCDYQRRLLNLETAQQQLHQDEFDRLKALGQDDDCSAPEAAPVADDSDLQTFHGIALDMVDTLPILPEIKRTLRRAIREPMQQPTLEAAPVVTDEQLLSMRSWSSHGPTFDSDLVDFGRRCYSLNREPSAAQPLGARGSMEVQGYLDSIRVCAPQPPTTQPAQPVTPYGKADEQARRDRAGEAGKAAADASFEAVLAAQPTPPPALAGGLVEEVLRELPAGADSSCARAVIYVVELWAGRLGLVGAERRLREEAHQ